MIEAILNFGEVVIYFLVAMTCAAVLVIGVVAIVFGLRYLGRITRSQTLAAGPATNPSPTSTAGARRSWGSAISGFLGFVIKLLFALLLIGVAVAVTSWFFGWLDISHLMPNTNPQPPTPQPAPATTPSGPSWWSKKENWQLFFAMFGVLTFVVVAGYFGTSHKRGWLPAIGGLLVALPALFFGMELINNDGDVSKTWKSIFRIDPTMQASAAQAPTRAPATPPPSVLNAGDAYSIPCTLGQAFVIEMKKGAVITNNHGCVLATRVMHNGDNSPSTFHFTAANAAPKLVTPTIAQCNPGETCIAPDIIKASSDVAVIKIAACPRQKGVIPGTYECVP